MQYNSIDELLTQLRVILQANGSARIYRTVFVLLPDGDSWCDVLAPTAQRRRKTAPAFAALHFKRTLAGTYARAQTYISVGWACRTAACISVAARGFLSGAHSVVQQACQVKALMRHTGSAIAGLRRGILPDYAQHRAKSPARASRFRAACPHMLLPAHTAM